MFTTHLNLSKNPQRAKKCHESLVTPTNKPHKVLNTVHFSILSISTKSLWCTNQCAGFQVYSDEQGTFPDLRVLSALGQICKLMNIMYYSYSLFPRERIIFSELCDGSDSIYTLVCLSVHVIVNKLGVQHQISL